MPKLKTDTGDAAETCVRFSALVVGWLVGPQFMTAASWADLRDLAETHECPRCAAPPIGDRADLIGACDRALAVA